MQRIFLISLMSLFTWNGFTQEERPSIHEVQLNEYNSTGITEAEYYEEQPTELVPFEKASCDLTKIVYGWHPYWVGSAYQNYQWDLLSHMSFFSYEVNAADGEPNSTHGWATSAAVDAALASGNTKVTLCVTLFSGHTAFFGSPTAQQTLIDNLIDLVDSRGAHGVNIDFEGIPGALATDFANFMVDLCTQMHAAIPGSEVSTVLYAVDWNDVFDFSIMEPHVDHYIIMGYAYYYSGSSTAGPTDPLYHFGSSYNYTLSRTITDYLYAGCPKEKLVMGLPSYGYEWETAGLTVPSATVGGGTARTYAFVKNNTSGNYSAGNHIWETDSYTDVYAFNNGANRQCLISLDDGWRKRLEHINRTGIAGIGIWALGYDNGYTGLWDAMNDYLTTCYEDSCSGTIHDFGGPTRNYYNREDYTWTIAPPNSTAIDVDFSMFNVELDYDYLYIYDGATTASPQIAGSPFTGTAGPGSFSSSTGALTFRFTSDGATVTPGFLATYSCVNIPEPVASFSTSELTICLGDSIQLQNTSQDADSYQWATSAGGLSNATAENPYLFPSSSGTYTISLVVTNGTGVDSTGQALAVTVNNPPTAIAGMSSTNLTYPTDATVFFTNSSNNASSYWWDFGDGTTSTDAQPWHTYGSSGVFDGYLVAMNAGCANDTTFFTINVGTASLSEHEFEEVVIFPNPFDQLITIETVMKVNQFELVDMKGAKIAVDATPNANGYELKPQVAAPGIYVLTIFTDTHVIRERIEKR